MPAISLNNVDFGYGGDPVLRDISFEVEEGITFGLAGLNGAGKTTLIKTMLGLRDAHKGDVNVLGHTPGDMEAKKNLAYLPERFDPPWFLKGREFIHFSGRLYRTIIDDARIDETAGSIDLDPACLDQKVQTYSKGMRQKLGLLASFLSGVHLLILDEPMSGLDPKARIGVKELLYQARREGRTIFLSSHILSDMDEVCDQIAVIDRAELVYSGAPADLRTQTGESYLERAFIRLIDAGEAA